MDANYLKVFMYLFNKCVRYGNAWVYDYQRMSKDLNLYGRKLIGIITYLQEHGFFYYEYESKTIKANDVLWQFVESEDERFFDTPIEGQMTETLYAANDFEKSPSVEPKPKKTAVKPKKATAKKKEVKLKPMSEQEFAKSVEQFKNEQ